MKTKDKQTKEFDTVKTFIEIKTKISNDIQGMNFEELSAYLQTAKSKPKS